jgi:hypothetical protein
MINPDQEQMPRALYKWKTKKISVKSKYEDMYPFLPAEEIQENML